MPIFKARKDLNCQKCAVNIFTGGTGWNTCGTPQCSTKKSIKSRLSGLVEHWNSGTHIDLPKKLNLLIQ
jgi:hypothetical protein